MFANTLMFIFGFCCLLTFGCFCAAAWGALTGDWELVWRGAAATGFYLCVSSFFAWLWEQVEKDGV